MYSRLAELAEHTDDDLPDTINLTQEQVDQYYPLWALYVATGRRFLPSQLMIEPAEPLAAILEINSYFEKIAKLEETDSDASQ